MKKKVKPDGGKQNARLIGKKKEARDTPALLVFIFILAKPACTILTVPEGTR